MRRNVNAGFNGVLHGVQDSILPLPVAPKIFTRNVPEVLQVAPITSNPIDAVFHSLSIHHHGYSPAAK
jgi:hypothetical protein